MPPLILFKTWIIRIWGAEPVDRLILKGMEFYAFHGVLPQEQHLGQRFIIDVELSLDLAPAGRTDDPEQTVNYARVFRLVEEVVTGAPCRLIEAVAEKVAGAILEQFPVSEVLVRVKKPGAPVPGHFAYMGVEIRRRR
ncbi:dihydroneopterin aldolase [Desulfofundulus australicus DSM 11792]|uniref:7,8-dihydroneopterin aldolase n=1 Tax=Desulfofundulus australicus DSM 11792 TaxID=1121425 RepID=A0A1M4SC74_9FIRM|nr:7,8-dihydroneopterin aldolase/epimerase/oxygenase [Thermoanaerobacter sp.]SHE29824.1 dihydroneopterin aldolase [Desulfofundulus australicus DSM 11792]